MQKNTIHLCHSQREHQHFNFCHLQLCVLSFPLSLSFRSHHCLTSRLSFHADTLLSHLTLSSTCSNLLAHTSSPLFHTLCCSGLLMNSSTIFISAPCHLTLPPGSLSSHAADNLYSSPLFQVKPPPRFSSTCSLLSLQITTAASNIIVHGDSCLASSVSLPITIETRQDSEPFLSANCL